MKRNNVSANTMPLVGKKLKDIAKNLFAGFAVLTDKTFVVGDYIETEKFSGNIEDISFRTTRIRTTDNSLITVPAASVVRLLLPLLPSNPHSQRELHFPGTFLHLPEYLPLPAA